MLQKEQKGKGVAKDASEEILYKIDIPANRYDMLCLEGIARALNIFNQRLSKSTIPVGQHARCRITAQHWLQHQCCLHMLLRAHAPKCSMTRRRGRSTALAYHSELSPIMQGRRWSA